MSRRLYRALAVILAAGILVVPGCGRGNESSGPAAAGERKVLYWRSPMDATFVSDKPGKDRMGMELVPVYEGDEQEARGVVRIDRGTVQKIGVRTARVTRRPVSREIRTVGIVTYDETRLVHVHTKVNGWLQELYADFTGEFVRKGQPLFSIYSPELVSTQQEYLLALKAQRYLADSPVPEIAGGAQDLLQSTRERLRLFDIREEHLKELVASGQPSTTLDLHAPIDGFVTEKMALEGMYVTPAMKLYTIADLSHVWIDADVYEYEVPLVREGQAATVTSAYDPGQVLHGRVAYVYPYLDPKTRTVKVRLDFTNPNLRLKPDMYVDVKLETGQPVTSVAVPKEAVLRTGKRDVVFIDLGDGRFQSREVELGIEAPEYYQVLSGLSEGDVVVVSAQFLLDSESNLREAVERMTDSDSQSPENPQAADKAHETGAEDEDAHTDH